MQEVNVRVAVRVRPLLPKEKLDGEDACVRVIQTSNQIVIGKDKAFTYDYILGNSATQEETYRTCVEPLVNSIFEGYNATVFAYGQTGSGKTHTIGGGNVSLLLESEYGIIPRSLSQMFECMQHNENIQYRVKVSYIEIYKEELQDLLDPDESKEMHVREDENGNTVIVGAREIECESLDEVMSCLESGSAVRHTESTQMNEHSSRSHSIFTIIVAQKWSETDAISSEHRSRYEEDETNETLEHTMSGKFHFVDLAGSERAHRTGNVGDRFKESVHINSGLLALGNVISSLGDPKKRSHHIPYRDSKITRLLKDSLGGNAKTLMICCISPAASNFDESLNALKYANRARNIKNKPIINRDLQSIKFEEMQFEIKALREELAIARQKTGISRVESNLEDMNQIKVLEDKVSGLQDSCEQYQVLVEDACNLLMDVKERNNLTQSQTGRLLAWLDLIEKAKNKMPSLKEWGSQKIKDLEHKVKKYKEDLKSDEEIFAEKTKEVNGLVERIAELEMQVVERCNDLGETQIRFQKQEEQLIEQQMVIDDLQKALKSQLIRASSVMDIDAVTASAPPQTGRRPKSVPAHILRKQDMFYSHLRPPSRNIKSSPALFSVDQVMQNFRARSQLLITRLEDCDEVLHQTFSDDGANSEEEPNGESGFVRKGTFRVKKPTKGDNKENEIHIPELKTSIEVARNSGYGMDALDSGRRDSRLINIENTSKSQEVQKKIKHTQMKALEANQKIRDLSINIKMKEQLIRELVKNEKNADIMNRQYAEKVKELEKEKEQVVVYLSETQRALTDLEAKEQQESVEKQKLEKEYRKKIEAAKAKMTVLQKKQKESEKIANFVSQNEKKILDLSHNVERMKQQQEILQRKLKEETEKKIRLEHEKVKENQRVKELELKNEQQQKILKRKNEEIAIVQRKLRGGSASTTGGDEHDDQRRWLDVEMEKVLEQRKQMEGLAEELKKREAIIAKKEDLLAEKSELEMKKLRSSQVMNKNLLSVSQKLESVEKRLEEKSNELANIPEDRLAHRKEEIHKLNQAREKYQKQRSVIDGKLHEGAVLSAEEERRLIEMDEAIEALDAAIEYKNEVIQNRQKEIRHSQMLTQSEDNLMNRLNSLGSQETKSLLSKYFDKVIKLREEERKYILQCNEMDMKVDEQDRLIRDLELALQKAGMETDRRLIRQQNEYEQKLQLLMGQITEGGSNIDVDKDARIQQLEKDLYYYKKTSRETRKKIRELLASGVLGKTGDEAELQTLVQSVTDSLQTPRDVGGGGENILSKKSSHHGDQYNGDVMSARDRQHGSGDGDKRSGSRPSSAKSGLTPVKISRRDLRPMTEAEVSLRRSHLNTSLNSQNPTDSLEDHNPWT